MSGSQSPQTKALGTQSPVDAKQKCAASKTADSTALQNRVLYGYDMRMAAQTHRIRISTRGDNQVLDLTKEVCSAVATGSIRDGTVTVFVVGSTGGITTTEFEPGLVQRDLAVAFEKIAPRDGTYLHEQTWHDDNGHSHVRASLLGPSITVPLVGGEMTLGTWQQIVLLDFDSRPRDREIIVQVVG